MNDTTPLPFEPAVPGPAETQSWSRPLAITFTGSGSEYFRIWIVNLLLTLVTLGFYYPWAKVRRLRYFYGNTVVGDHALDFHGDPKRMLRGFLLVGAMLLLYSVAGRVSPTAGLIAFVIIAAVWPALFRASLRFRLANTSWRGLRFRFTGDVGGAYRAMLPLFIPGVLVLGATLGVNPESGAAPSPVVGIVVLVAMTAAGLMLPLLWWLLKRYQHGHYALGGLRTELRTGPGAFYLVALKSFGVGLSGLFAAGVFAGFVNAIGSASSKGPDQAAKFLLIAGSLLVGYAILVLIGTPYITARMQNLVWGRTESDDIRFSSTLRFRSLFGLTLKNWLLMLVTLGFYWPFAKIATTRLRLEAVSVQTRASVDQIVAQGQERANDATGDAAGDLFGIDIGL